MPSATQLRSFYRLHPAAGIGLALGPAAGVIDLEVDDQEEARAFFDRLFGGDPPLTLGWHSSRGEHRLYGWDGRLERLARSAVVPLASGAVELRLGGRGTQVASVCPPSPDGCGRRREWNGTWMLSPFPEPLLDELARLKAARVVSRAGRQPVRSGRYAAAALEREAAIVRAAGPGERNRTLNRAAYHLGQLIAAGMLDRRLVEVELGDAGLAAGLPEREIIATLQSGIEAGLRNPRIAGAGG